MPPILTLPSQPRDPGLPARPRPTLAAALVASALGALAPATHASMFAGETLDAVANGISWAVLVLVPVIGIVLFWIVHVMPEKIAHRRHHPQVEAIQTLCLLSLVFGGLLWPIAWLWAYTKPVAYKVAYGTDKHDDYFDEAGEKVRSGSLVAAEIRTLKRELDEMHARGALPAKLVTLRDDIAALQAERQAERQAAAERGDA